MLIAWSIFLHQNQYGGLYKGLDEGPNEIDIIALMIKICLPNLFLGK